MAISSTRHNRRHGSSSSATKQKVELLLREALEAQRAHRVQRALNLCESALKLDSQSVEALCVYSALATGVGQPENAIATARRATTLRPDHAEAHHCLGVALRRLGQVEGAIASLGRAIELQPERLDSLLELAMAFLDAGDWKGAEPFLNRALDIDPGSSPAQTALARFYRGTGRIDDAVAACRRAIDLDPNSVEANMLLGNMSRDAGDLEGAITAFNHAIAVAPNRPDAWSNLLLTLQCSDRIPAGEIAEKHREFGRHFGSLMLPLPAPRPRPASGRRLKIGYLSSGLRRHAVAKFFEPLIESHDKSRFEIHCYYNFPAADEITNRIKGRAEHFSIVCGMRDGYVAARIRRDEIDILVDLDGHTAPNRLPVFLLRPAPIQVTWLGYLATTGISAIDYRLTDARADPPGVADDLHAEKLWRLPATAWCYRPYDEAPHPGPLPLAANGFPTFVSLNNPGKVTRSVLELWGRIMRETPLSRLILHISRQASRLAEIETFFEDQGIAASRLLLVDRQSIDQYLALYARADIALDTWPCAGGTTTCDALWMGVPVVTLAGESSFSRTGVSLLSSTGLGEYATETPEAYVAQAVALASDPPRLAGLRAGLRGRLQSSCLTDGPQLARDIEAAFLGMWERHVARREGSRL